MASRAYNHALELDTSSKTAREKLSLVNELISAPPVPEIEKSVVAMATPEPKMEAKPKQEKNRKLNLCKNRKSSQSQRSKKRNL